MSTPKVSVIMSVYNAELYLAESIESILNQTYKNFEFIIIDDCSTDSSLDILNIYSQQDSRIKILQKKQNKGTQGFIENLNWGINEAQGEYIARMDADDISMPHRFEKQVNFLDQNQSIFIVGAQIDLIDKSNKVIGEKIAACNNNDIQKKMLKTIQLYHPVIMFRNQNIKYREKTWYCEDYDLYLRLITEGKKMANLNEKLLQYRILNNSISRNNKFIKYLFLNKVFEMYYERKIKNIDSYNTIQPIAFYNILNKNYKNTLDELEYAASTSVKYNLKQNLIEILNKKNYIYPKSSRMKFFKYISLLPDSLFNIYSKIYRKKNYDIRHLH